MFSRPQCDLELNMNEVDPDLWLAPHLPSLIVSPSGWLFPYLPNILNFVRFGGVYIGISAR